MKFLVSYVFEVEQDVEATDVVAAKEMARKSCERIADGIELSKVVKSQTVVLNKVKNVVPLNEND